MVGFHLVIYENEIFKLSLCKKRRIPLVTSLMTSVNIHTPLLFLLGYYLFMLLKINHMIVVREEYISEKNC